MFRLAILVGCRYSYWVISISGEDYQIGLFVNTDFAKAPGFYLPLDIDLFNGYLFQW